MEIWHFPAIFAIGLLAGLINTLAGGGSLLTLPMLIFMGLPTAVANGTNRIAILVQCLFAIAGFKKKGISHFKLSFLFSVPAVFGAILGAQVAIDISDLLFKRVLAVIMMLVLGLNFRDSRHSSGETPKSTHRPDSVGRKKPAKSGSVNRQARKDDLTGSGRTRFIVTMVSLFFIGLYGGVIQVGVGFITIAVLTTITGCNLVVANSHKVFIAGIYTFFALSVFALKGKVCWTIGLFLAAGMGLGGWIGSHLAVVKGERLIRLVITICVVVMVIKLSGLFP